IIGGERKSAELTTGFLRIPLTTSGLGLRLLYGLGSVPLGSSILLSHENRRVHRPRSLTGEAFSGLSLGSGLLPRQALRRTSNRPSSLCIQGLKGCVVRP